MILDCDDAMNGMVVVVGAGFFCTWGWVWVESEGRGRVVVVVRLVWEGGGIRDGGVGWGAWKSIASWVIMR